MDMTQGNTLKRSSVYREKRFPDTAMIAEGMRRTRTLALIMGSVVWAAAILVPLMRIGSYDAAVRPVLYGPIQINPLLLLSFTVFAPILTLKAFDFLDSRAGSDLFHSMPVKRRTLAANFLAAESIWLVIIIGGSMLLSSVCCKILYRSITLDTTYLWICFLQMLAASVLVEMSVFLAMTVTGTFLTNIVTALGLIFVPRILIIAAGEMLSQLVPMISTRHLPLLFTNRLNIVTGLVFGALQGRSFYGEAGPLYYAPSVLYTFLLAAVYAAAGCVLFVRRPSETAGCSALGEKLQSVIRIGIGFIISIPAAMAVCTGFPLYDGTSAISELTILVTVLLAAFGSMFLYEYLSAHRLLTWKKLMTGILVILLLDAVWIAGGRLMARICSSERIETDQIESVTFPETGYMSPSHLFSDISGYDQSWWGEDLSGLPMTGEEIRKIVSLRHDQTAGETELRDEVEILDGTNAAEVSSDIYHEHYNIETRIRLKGGKEVYRYLEFTGNDLAEIWNAAAPEIGDYMTHLPDLNELFSLWWEDMYGEELAPVYECYGKELNAMDAENWISILEDPASYESDVLRMIIVRDGNYLGAALPITEDFPKTQKLLRKMAGGYQAETESD